MHSVRLSRSGRSPIRFGVAMVVLSVAFRIMRVRIFSAFCKGVLMIDGMSYVMHWPKGMIGYLLHRFFSGLAIELNPGRSSGSLMIIAPHADDETLGCAATILQASQAGRRVCVIIVSDGSQSIQSAFISPQQLAALRVDEAVAALNVLGVAREDIVFLGFPDSRLQEHSLKVAETLKRQISALRPAEIYTPYGIDGHQDHRAVAAAVNSLVEAGMITCSVYEYPVWFWPRRALWHLAMPARLMRLRKVSTEGFLAKKRQAMEAYRSQCENITGELNARFLEKKFLVNFFRPYELFFQKNTQRRQEPCARRGHETRLMTKAVQKRSSGEG